MFLTNEELKTLTGYESAAWQMRWLTNHGWIFERAANGRPIVLRNHAEKRMSDISDSKSWSPNFDAMRKVA